MTATVSQLRRQLEKRARRGGRGFPLGTLAFYGPNDRRASKMVAAIVERADAEPSTIRKWQSDGNDVRDEPDMLREVLPFFEEHSVKGIAMADRIIGCPHEEGIDYEGTMCPRCLYWAGRDRWTGKPLR